MPQEGTQEKKGDTAQRPRREGSTHLNCSEFDGRPLTDTCSRNDVPCPAVVVMLSSVSLWTLTNGITCTLPVDVSLMLTDTSDAGRPR